MGSVFISSTSEDLREYRLATRDAVLALGLRPVMMEYSPAAVVPPLPECLAAVSSCQAFIVILAHRYGLVPPDQLNAGAKSITWLESERALINRLSVLPFLLDKNTPWPAELKESHRITQAVDEHYTVPADLIGEVSRNVRLLKEFRAWLERNFTCATFSSPNDLRARVVQALHIWLEREPQYKPVGAFAPVQSPTPYLEWLRDQTATIDIRGLGEGRSPNFPIDKLYIPLTTPRIGEDQLEHRSATDLSTLLSNRRVTIVGDPGSGKTTFLRRITYDLARGIPLTGKMRSSPFPFFIRISELIGHLNQAIRDQARNIPADNEDPQWIVHFLASRSAVLGWGLSGAFFAEKLTNAEAIVLLDGLDETPDQSTRESVARLFERATGRFEHCQFVVTSRPHAYSGSAVLKGFLEAHVEPFTDDAIDMFLERWCHGLYPDSPSRAKQHNEELREALRARPEIRRMARNPVMLTALSVVHWNERRLPEQRAALYDAILVWLSRQRTQQDRERPERCLTLLGELAFAMQTCNHGRQVRVPLEWAAKTLRNEFGDSTRDALKFLERESADSGVIVARENQVQFWHLTFQEYLAARVIAGTPEAEQQKLLLLDHKLYESEWREVILLLAGVLFGRGEGKGKIDRLVSAALTALPTKPSLVDKAQCAGVLGQIMRDLAPLSYKPQDPRYADLVGSVLGIFDIEGAKDLPFSIRIEAAEALGQTGDSRLEKPTWIEIENFAIAKFPVSVSQFARFVEDDGYSQKRWWQFGGFGRMKAPLDWEEQLQHPNRPVTNLNWYEASAYCLWAGVRLPTEEEWCRAATGGKFRRFPWGDEPPDGERLNWGGSGPQHPTPVGLYPLGSSPYGVMDMSGNVWEWTVSVAEKGSERRVLKGGAWDSGRDSIECQFRQANFPENRYNAGLRCAKKID